VKVNTDLAEQLDELQARLVRKTQKDNAPNPEPLRFTTEFVLKLAILGRAFAGKKTVAK
jgi:hypothetical protein